MIYIRNKLFFTYMNIDIITSSSDEVCLSIKKFDVGILYIIQHELLKHVEFVGVIIKHPLTNECWMRVKTRDTKPYDAIIEANDRAISMSNKISDLFTKIGKEVTSK